MMNQGWMQLSYQIVLKSQQKSEDLKRGDIA
jgi:hypothetical protein